MVEDMSILQCLEQAWPIARAMQMLVVAITRSTEPVIVLLGPDSPLVLALDVWSPGKPLHPGKAPH